MRREALLVLVAGWVGWVSVYYTRVILSPTLPRIERDLGISHAEAGLLMTAYFIPYALSQIPGGKLSDRYGPRYVLAASILIMAFPTALMGFAKNLAEALFLRVVTGAGAGFYFAPLNSVIFNQFAGRERGRTLGLTSSGAGFGIILGAALTGFLVETFGWRFLLFLSVGAVLTLPLFLRLSEEPLPSRRASAQGRGGVEWRAMKYPVTIGFIHHLTYNVFLTYVPLFLVQNRQFSVAGASLAFSTIPLLMLLGHPISGYLADFFDRRSLVVASLMGCTVSILAFLRSWDVVYLGASLFLMSATLNTLYTPLTAYAMDASRPSSIGINLATLNMMAYVGSAAGPYIAGLIADRYGFEISFTSMAALMALALIPAFRMERK